MFARKIIICIFLLVLPRTVEAVSYKELSRIKQNFSVILVPSDTDPFHFINATLLMKKKWRFIFLHYLTREHGRI